MLCCVGLGEDGGVGERRGLLGICGTNGETV